VQVAELILVGEWCRSGTFTELTAIVLVCIHVPAAVTKVRVYTAAGADRIQLVVPLHEAASK